MSDSSPLEKTPLHISELVELAYSVAKEQFGSQFFSFTSIWSKVWKGAEGFSKEKVESWIGYFYTELLTDPRFVVFSFNKWRLKEYMDFDEVRKLEKTIFSDDSVFEEEYESYLSEKNKKEVEIIMETSTDDEVSMDDLEEKEDSSDDEEDKDGDDVVDDSFEEDL